MNEQNSNTINEIIGTWKDSLIHSLIQSNISHDYILETLGKLDIRAEYARAKKKVDEEEVLDKATTVLVEMIDRFCDECVKSGRWRNYDFIARKADVAEAILEKLNINLNDLVPTEYATSQGGEMNVSRGPSAAMQKVITTSLIPPHNYKYRTVEEAVLAGDREAAEAILDANDKRYRERLEREKSQPKTVRPSSAHNEENHDA